MLKDTMTDRNAGFTLSVDAPDIDTAEIVTEDAPGDVLLPYTMPQAEYMCGCIATAVGMLLGYYDLYGYTENGLRYDFSKLIPGTISIDSRGSDGGSIYDMTDPSVLALFIASPEYKARFYDQTAEHEKPYTFVSGDPSKGLNISVWNCLADYLGTGQYWRGNGDLATSFYYASLEQLKTNGWTYDVSGTVTIPAEWHDFKYGLSLYLDIVGYELDERRTFTVEAKNFTFSDFKAQIDAGHPVLVSMNNSNGGGHMVIAYGYNNSTQEIIFDDTYRTDCRMKWGGSYYYSSKYYELSAFSVIRLATDEAPPPVEVCRNHVPVSTGTLIVDKTLTGSGAATRMYVYGGGTASRTTVASGGVLRVSNGGTALSTTVNSSGFVYVYDGGAANSLTLNSSSYVYASGGIVRSAAVNGKNCQLNIRSDGSAESATVKNGGYLLVSNGGIAKNTAVDMNGDMRVYSDGTASATTVQSGGYLLVSNGGTAISTTMKSNGLLYLSNGATGMNTTLRNLGVMVVSNGGRAVSTTVSSGGSMYVSNGGKADSVTLLSGGSAIVFTGGSADGLTISNGSMYIYGNAALTGRISLSSNSFLWIYQNGVLNFDISHRTANAGALVNNIALIQGNPTYTLTVSPGSQPLGTYALANGASSFNKTVTVKNTSGSTLGTVSVGTSLSTGGYTYALKQSAGALTLTITGSTSPSLSGKVATYTGNSRLISAADTLTGKLLHSSGEDKWMEVRAGGKASAVTISAGGSMFVSQNGSAINNTVLSSGRITVSNGGSAIGTIIGSGITERGRMDVYAGGTATRTIAGGYIHLSGGTVSSTVLERGGVMYVSNGGRAEHSIVNSVAAIIAYSGGRVNGTTVNSNGSMTVSGGAVVNDTVVNNLGRMDVYTGAKVSHTSVGKGGSMYIYGGASASDNTVAGVLYISRYGKLTGKNSLQSGAVVSAYDGSTVDFDLVGVAAGDAVRINNLSLIQGAPDYTITVSNSQAFGDYLLAYGAATFNKTVTVKNASGTKLGTITVGGTLKSGDNVYSLVRNNGTLSLTVASHLPATEDLNGDGRADIVMTIVKSGHGAYGATGAWLIQADQTAAWGDLSTHSAGWEIFGMGRTAAGKSTDDVYLKSTGNVVGAWTTDATGKVNGWTTVGEFDSKTQVLGLGDFNGDGQSDLLLRNTNGAVGCYLTDGTGWNLFQSIGSEWTLAAVGDLNGDGRDDVVLKHDAGFAGSWLTQADCTMAWANLDTLPTGFSIVGAGDFDGDGTSDVLLKNGNYYGAWIVQNGSAAGWMGLGDLGSVTVEQIADFDADGKEDLRVRTATGDIGTLLVKGADTLKWKHYGSVGQEWSTSLAAI